MKIITLENDVLRIELLPEAGGKIISFFRKDKDFELTVKGKNDRNVRPSEKDGFASFAYGMDEAFPNIDAEEINWKGRRLVYPDHGEIWRREFKVLEQDARETKLAASSAEFGYRYEKKLSLRGWELKIAFHIINEGKEELPCIWTWHGLMRYEEDMEILLPPEITHCRNVLGGGILGEAGKIYPVDSPLYDFRRVPKRNTCSMVKFYGEERVTEGCCGFFYPSRNVKCLLKYDRQALPYLGVWITAGGFQGDFNCALEPSSGFYDGIGNAQKLGRLPVLRAGEKLGFEFSVSLF